MIKLNEFFKKEKLVGSTLSLSALFLMILVAIFLKIISKTDATANVITTKSKCFIVSEDEISFQLFVKKSVIIN